jgi:hypothetical protein
MRCDAMRCDAMRCDAMRCDAMRCDAMRCDAMRGKWRQEVCKSGLLIPCLRCNRDACDSCGSARQTRRARLIATVCLVCGEVSGTREGRAGCCECGGAKEFVCIEVHGTIVRWDGTHANSTHCLPLALGAKCTKFGHEGSTPKSTLTKLHEARARRMQVGLVETALRTCGLSVCILSSAGSKLHTHTHEKQDLPRSVQAGASTKQWAEWQAVIVHKGGVRS